MSENQEQTGLAARVRKVVNTVTGGDAAAKDQPQANTLDQMEGESDADYVKRVEAAKAAAEAADKAKSDAEALAKAKAEAEATAKALTEAKAKADAEAAAKAAEAAKAKAEAEQLDMVDAVIPKTFKLVLQDGSEKVYVDGTYPMPRAHAEHWFAKAHGVKLYQSVKK